MTMELTPVGLWTHALDMQPLARAQELAAELDELGYGVDPAAGDGGPRPDRVLGPAARGDLAHRGRHRHRRDLVT